MGMMSMRLRVGVASIGFLALTLGACAGTQVSAQRAEFVSTIPTCVSDKECELKWAAARRWVLQTSPYRIQHMTNDFLETYNSEPHSPKLAVRVVKEPVDATRYRIVVTTGCNNMFGCFPDSWEAALSFNRYVNAVSP